MLTVKTSMTEGVQFDNLYEKKCTSCLPESVQHKINRFQL